MSHKKENKKKMTKTNFITKLLSILVNINDISDETYNNFLKRTKNVLNEEEFEILKNIKEINLNEIKLLQSLISKIEQVNFFVIQKKLYLFFIKNNNDFYQLLRKYTNYKIRKIEKKHIKEKKAHKKITDLDSNSKILKTNLLKNFPKDIDEINIYIDEVWPVVGENEHSNTLSSRNIGAIAGIIWLGKKPNYKELPLIPTHLRTEGKSEAYKYSNIAPKLEKLMNCRKAIPFFMPIELPKDVNAQVYYFELLQITLKVLLGWVLPQKGNFIKVNVYCEHIDIYEDNTNKTEFFDGIFESLTLTTNRFERFIINKVVWKGKEFEYIPYGDLVGYVGLQHIDLNKRLAKLININNWNTFIPISLDTYKQLEKLDDFNTQDDIENIFDLLISLNKAKLARAIFNLLNSKFDKSDEFKNKVINIIENYYMNKVRDMDTLRLVYYYFNDLIKGIKTDNLLYKTQIQIILIKFQYANHEGSPKKIETLLNEYKNIRNKAVSDNRELVLYTDLNFIVHLNDQFKFAKSLKIIKELTEGFGFSFYSKLNQAKALSTYGQVLALSENYNEASKKFITAIDYFQDADILIDSKHKEIEKTAIYKIINLINMNNSEAIGEFRALLQENNLTIEDIAKTKNSRWNYIHYVLVKLLYNFDIEEFDEYLENITLFYKEQHPFEVIYLYKALLLIKKGENNNKIKEMFDIAVKIINKDTHGAIIKLIGSVILVIALIYFPNNKEYKQLFKKYILEVDKNMPKAKDYIGKIKYFSKNAKETDIKEILKILPFNYL